MNVQFQLKTLVRLVALVVVCGIASAIIAKPPADASDGYGITAFAMADGSVPGALLEGRSVAAGTAER